MAGALNSETKRFKEQVAPIIAYLVYHLHASQKIIDHVIVIHANVIVTRGTITKQRPGVRSVIIPTTTLTILHARPIKRSYSSSAIFDFVFMQSQAENLKDPLCERKIYAFNNWLMEVQMGAYRQRYFQQDIMSS